MDVIRGLTILFVLNFVGTIAFIFLYFLAAKEKKSIKEITVISLLLATINLFVKIFSLVFFLHMGLFLLVSLEAIISISAYSALLYYRYKFHILEILIISTCLTIFFSSLWMKLIGLL